MYADDADDVINAEDVDDVIFNDDDDRGARGNRGEFICVCAAGGNAKETSICSLLGVTSIWCIWTSGVAGGRMEESRLSFFSG